MRAGLIALTAAVALSGAAHGQTRGGIDHASTTRSYCNVPEAMSFFPPGATIGRGQNVMTMTNSGQPCRHMLYNAEGGGRAGYSRLELTRPPTSGTVTLSPPHFSYLPNPGFVGTDRFVIATPRAVWTFTVNVLPPGQR